LLKISLSRYNVEEKQSLSIIFYECLLLLNYIVLNHYHNRYYLQNVFFFFKEGTFINYCHSKNEMNSGIFHSKKNKVLNLSEYNIEYFKKINCLFFTNMNVTKKISEYKLEDFLLFFQDFTNCQAILKSNKLKTFLKKKFELKYLFLIILYYLTKFCFVESKTKTFFFQNDKPEEIKIYLKFEKDKYFLDDFSLRYFSHFYYMIQNIFFNTDKMYFLNSKKFYEFEEIKFFKNLKITEKNNYNKLCSITENFLFEKIFNLIYEYNIDGLNDFIKNFFIESVYTLLVPGAENWFDYINEETTMADFFLQKTIKEKKFFRILQLTDSIAFSYIEILKGFFLFDLDLRILQKKKAEIEKKKKNKENEQAKTEQKFSLNQVLLEKNFLDEFFEQKNLVTFNETVTEEKFFILQFFYFISYFGKEKDFHYDKDRFNFNKKWLDTNLNKVQFLKKIFLEKFFKKYDKNQEKNFLKVFKIFIIFRNNLFLKFFDVIFQNYSILWYENFVISLYDIYNYEIVENKLLEKETPYIFQLTTTDYAVLYKDRIFFSKDIIECILNWILIIAFCKNYTLKYKNKQIYVYNILVELMEVLNKNYAEDYNFHLFEHKLINMSKELKIENFFQEYSSYKKLQKLEKQKYKITKVQKNNISESGIFKLQKNFFEKIRVEDDNINELDNIEEEKNKILNSDSENDDALKNIKVNEFNLINTLDDCEDKNFTNKDLVFYDANYYDEETEKQQTKEKEQKKDQEQEQKKEKIEFDNNKIFLNDKKNFLNENKKEKEKKKKDDSNNKLVQLYF